MAHYITTVLDTHPSTMASHLQRLLTALVLAVGAGSAFGFQGITYSSSAAPSSCLSGGGAKPTTIASRRSQRSLAATDTDTKSTSTTGTEKASTLRSLTFSNIPKDQEPDILCDFLLELGACSTAIIDADRGTDKEQPLFGEPGADAWQDSLQWAAPVWNRCNVSAHFPASVDIPFVLDMVAETFDEFSGLRDEHVVEQVPDMDWVVHVQQSWKPILVANKFVLRFPWHTDKDVTQVVSNGFIASESELVQLELQGGIAFGTGEHPTTQLCLEWIDTIVSQHAHDNKDEPFTILDYGTGSGILGMAACKLSPERVQAVGIDIDIDAIRIANANAVDNNVSMRSYLPPLAETADDESKSLLLKAHAHATAQLGERGETGDDLLLPVSLENVSYDVIVANILAAPLVALASTLASLVRPGGFLGMSGILVQQDEMILEAYTAAGFENVQVEKTLGGWILVTGTKREE